MFGRTVTKAAKLKAKLRPEPNQTWTILRGDLVQVIQGDEKGKKGKVLKVIRKENRCIVEGVNTRTKYIKDQEKQTRQKIKLESPLPVSYLALIDPSDNLATSVDYKTVNGEKVRVSKRTGTVIPKPQEVLSRQTPRNTNIGPKDTLPDDVIEVTFNPEVELTQKLNDFYPFKN